MSHENGATGPHPHPERLKGWMLIIRATSMRGPAVRQALDELRARGLWLSKEQHEDALIRERMDPQVTNK